MQKHRGWMAGSIFKKLRSLDAKKQDLNGISFELMWTAG
jgi:hypothetical protein